MRYKYKTKSKSDLIVFMLDGERVNLVGGSVKQTLPSTKKNPPRTVSVRGITDQDVEKLLSDPAKYGDWSDKFIDTVSGFTPKGAAGTLGIAPASGSVKKSPVVADEKQEPVIEVESDTETEPEKEPEKPKAKSKAKTKK